LSRTACSKTAAGGFCVRPHYDRLAEIRLSHVPFCDVAKPDSKIASVDCGMAAKNGLEADTPPAFKRMLIMGNGGCGKTWLAHRISERLGFPAIHLDDMHWEPGHYGKARDTALRDDDVKAAAQVDEWVMEGVYGQLVNMVLDRVTTLVWIDLPEEECIANIKERGIQGGGSDTRFQDLLRWVAEYRTRKKNWNSFEAHARLFDGYAGPKSSLTSRSEILAYLAQFRPAALNS
jgi:adenylate kinase family enzyme